MNLKKKKKGQLNGFFLPDNCKNYGISKSMPIFK